MANRRRAAPVAGVLLLAGGALARPAHARAPLADEVAARLSLSYVPACALCHRGGTGAGPVDTPFGTSMRAHGLSASVDSVAPALDGLRRDRVDSDGDGTGDVDELLQGTDPNGDDDGGCSVPGRAGRPAGTTVGWLAVCALAIALRTRKTIAARMTCARDARPNAIVSRA